MPNPSKKRGRPTRTQASADARELIEAGAPFDAVAILKSIAADPSQPAAGRVAAIRELKGWLADNEADQPAAAADAIHARTLELLRGRQRVN